jgi:phage tail sheath protein FI
MPVNPTYPGVYVQEIPSGVRTIAGVSTAIALFIGRAKMGPLNAPQLILSYSDFERVFTSEDAGSELAYAVRLFFQNGGTQCYVIRIAKDAVASAVNLKNEAGTEVLTVSAKSPGVSGDNILGITGEGDFQSGVAAGNDGSAPELKDYDAAYQVADREIDLFNLLILPKDSGHTDNTTNSLWGPASVFGQNRRAFLLIDAPVWADAQAAIDPQSGVNGLRVGLVKDYSAIFYPRLVIKNNGSDRKVGPAGAIAGLMARVDANRGVWKAPAGTEADIRGIVGVEQRFSDSENGVLNPNAINTLRVFPSGIVNWGARTMFGYNNSGSEYSYIPVRRLALFLEESLYRGLQWVVFEPNDEPLWSQIRLNVGAFMHGLFRQGAFQGKTPATAYFVKCDSETTTQNDINLGIVNIIVGFAPLKPAEFVILSLQQIAGQLET